jgi:hypothetical protein
MLMREPLLHIDHALPSEPQTIAPLVEQDWPDEGLSVGMALGMLVVVVGRAVFKGEVVTLTAGLGLELDSTVVVLDGAAEVPELPPVEDPSPRKDAEPLHV